jgi:PEP-CTERM motif-containing protein
MRSHASLAVMAAVLSLTTFTAARADRISPDRVVPFLDIAPKQHTLGAVKMLKSTESLNSEDRKRGVVFSYAHLTPGSNTGKLSIEGSTGTLSIERQSETKSRMRMPAFVVAIPEPTTIVLLATGMLGLVGAVRRRL